MGTSLSYAAGVSVQSFLPVASNQFVWTEDALRKIAVEPQIEFGFNANFQSNILRSENAPGNEVRSLNTYNFMVGFRWVDSFATYLELPVHTTDVTGIGSRSNLGDMRLFGKWKFLEAANDTEEWALALVPEIKFDSGQILTFTSDDSLSLGAKLAGEKIWGSSFITAASFGILYSKNANYVGIDYKSRFIWSASGLYLLTDRWGINAEIAGLSTGSAIAATRSDFYGGIRFLPSANLALFAGASTPVLHTEPKPDTRFMVGLRWTPYIFEDEAEEAPRPDKFEPLPPIPEDDTVWTPPLPVEEENQIAQTPIVTKTSIQLQDEIPFEHNSAVILPFGKKVLDEVARVILNNVSEFKSVVVEGHTNTIGTYKYNMRLSKNRAASVRRYLIERGVPASKLKAVGYGPTKPKIVKGASPEKILKMSRRVEFKIDRY
jgi:OOP family OmpA-OmpF porin